MTIGRFLLAAAVSVGLSALLLSRVDLGRLPELLASIDPTGLAIFVVLAFVGLFLRALRYRWLLPLEVSFGGVTLVTAVRNFLVDLFPARSGALSYPILLRTRLGVPMDAAIGSFGLSFLYDLVAMGSLLAIALVVELGRVSGAWVLATLVAILLASSILAVGLVGPVLRFVLERTADWKLRWDPRPFLADLARDVEAQESWAMRLRLLAISTAIRFVKFAGHWILLRAILVPAGELPDEFGFWRVFLGIAGAELSATLPIHGIAGFGTYEAAWALGFSGLGLDEEAAILSGFATHLISQALDYTTGIVALLLLFAIPFAGRQSRRNSS